MLLYDDGQFRVDWNGSSTFNVCMNGINTDCFTVYGITSAYDAEQIAIEHVKNNILGEE
jgi:hypothetical protein